MRAAGKAMELEPVEAVLKFLQSVGPGREAELYLRQFRSRPRERFAVLALDEDVLDSHCEQVALDVSFLGALGLYPMLAVGLHEPRPLGLPGLIDALGSARVAIELVDGPQPVSELSRATRNDAVPVWSIPGATGSERLAALGNTLAALGSDKLVFLRAQGGIWLGGRRVSLVNLSTEHEALVHEPSLDDATRTLIDESKTLALELVPHRLMIAVTSPLDLLHELFTVKGAGTLLRKGVRIERHDGYDGVDLARLRALLEASFHKSVQPSFFSRPIERVFVEESYRGAALVARTELGGYLSKFAVTPQAQGEGIGQDLWSALTANYGALFWRARSENPIRTWYERQCQGRYQAGTWTVYFRGLAPDQVPAAIEHALAQPVDF